MGRKSREKGKRGEREFAKYCREHGYDCRRGQQYSGLGGDDVVGLPNIHIEVKRTERLNLRDAIGQSVRDAAGKLAIVAHRKNNEDWVIIMTGEDFFRLYAKSSYGEEQDGTDTSEPV